MSVLAEVAAERRRQDERWGQQDHPDGTGGWVHEQTSAVLARQACQRIPALLDTPASVRFVSAEPLLGPIDLGVISEVGGCTCAGGHAESGYAHEPHCGTEPGPGWGLRWAIVGGESGPGARPMHPDWARSLRDQCQAARVPFFFKQWGGRTPKAGGRLLDGHEWDEYPT